MVQSQTAMPPHAHTQQICISCFNALMQNLGRESFVLLQMVLPMAGGELDRLQSGIRLPQQPLLCCLWLRQQPLR